MNFREMRLDEIVVADYNPRKELKPGSVAWKKLAASLDEFGLVEPLVFNERTQRLVGGRQRLAILRDRGDETAWVALVDVDEDREQALNVALNNPNLQSSWDASKLIRMAETMDADLWRLTGFDTVDDAHEILRRAEMTRDTSFLKDFLDAPPEAPVLDDPSPGTAGEPDGDDRRREVDHKEPHQHVSGPQYFEEKLVFTEEQRQIYYLAVGRIKQESSTDNTFEALTAHFAEYNRVWDAAHVDGRAAR